MMANSDKLSEIFRMEDEELEMFWERNEPEDFEGWQEGTIRFTRPSRKSVRLQLDPGDIRRIDRESHRTGIDRDQLIRSWVREKLRHIENQLGCKTGEQAPA